MSLALMVLAALCLAYFLVLLVGAGVRSGFIWFWAAAGAVLAALAWAQHRHPLPPAFWAVLAVFAAVGLLLFGESIGLLQAAGSAAVLAGVLLYTRAERR